MHYIWGIIKPFIFKLEVFCFEIIQGELQTCSQFSPPPQDYSSDFI